jgi:hypothetical protein
MTPEELVAQLQNVLSGRLSSAVLYGSAAAGDFVSGTSNYNVLVVVDRLGLAELDALAKPVAQWTKAGHRPPLLFTRGQLEASADVFPIEILDMRQSRRVLFGEDPLANVTVSHEHLRLQLERELKGKLLALRERYLLTGGRPKRLFELMVSSLAGFLVLVRAALRLFQEDVPATKLEALRLLATHLAFDPQPLLDVHELKHRRRKPREFSAPALFESYLKTIEQVVKAVDRHLHPHPKEKQGLSER